MNSKADILIVTATKVESQAVMQAFKKATGKGARPTRIGGLLYQDLGKVNGAAVFLGLSEMGSGGIGGTQEAVRKGIAALAPTAVIMVGIAFGIDEQKQSIGDVLVSQQLWLYDLQRVGADRITPRGDKPHASARLINWFQNADLNWQGARVRFGLILTGDKLVDNVDYRDQLKQFEPEAIGGEMEGAGLYVACQNSKVDWILVRGICDWADGHKAEDKDQRQRLAARNAASFVSYSLQQAPFTEEDEPSPSRISTDSETSQSHKVKVKQGEDKQALPTVKGKPFPLVTGSHLAAPTSSAEPEIPIFEVP